MAEENKIIEDSFALLYPDVNKDELLKNEEFNLFAGGRLSNEELSSVYKGYLDLTERIRKREMEKAAEILAKRISSVGALNSSNPPENTYFTREQVKSMSREQIRANYEKIRKSQEKWQ